MKQKRQSLKKKKSLTQPVGLVQFHISRDKIESKGAWRTDEGSDLLQSTFTQLGMMMIIVVWDVNTDLYIFWLHTGAETKRKKKSFVSCLLFAFERHLHCLYLQGLMACCRNCHDVSGSQLLEMSKINAVVLVTKKDAANPPPKKNS